MHHAGIVAAAAGCDRWRSRRKGGFRDPAGRARRRFAAPAGPIAACGSGYRGSDFRG
ncbi:hypothetical protein C4K18_3631 [Pseudomonas chlororaphis subsp. aurantiaca]|nr:hypothetical protein C4K18_3631 [Pseudomonas chlororaphis subsp. aurantiaca]